MPGKYLRKGVGRVLPGFQCRAKRSPEGACEQEASEDLYCVAPRGADHSLQNDDLATADRNETCTEYP